MAITTYNDNDYFNGDYTESGASGAGGVNWGSIISALMSNGSGNSTNLDAISRLLGAFAQGQLSQRQFEALLSQVYDRNMIAAQESRNHNESDAIKKLGQTAYIQGGGSHFNANGNHISIGGKDYNLPDLGIGPSPSSDAQRQGAATLEPELLKRLAPGGSYTPVPLSSYSQPGTAENIATYAGLGTSAASVILRLLMSSGLLSMTTHAALGGSAAAGAAGAGAGTGATGASGVSHLPPFGGAPGYGDSGGNGGFPDANSANPYATPNPFWMGGFGSSGGGGGGAFGEYGSINPNHD